MTESPSAPSQSSRDVLFSHLMQIRSALWRNSSAGRASVMVGAGFSRQAESLALAGGRLPLWSQLRQHLAELLRLPSEDASSVVEVAQLFQDRFGRPALDDAISEFIPDAAFGPGQAHRRLLSLPWSDVLTTNYDTLLERAAASTIERRYETIVVAEDLPKRASPRIVKLHGTLPSHRPFVISQQDYSDYPKRHAPFVNLVRQSAMETVLVLLGFSGHDPNFESWMRWVQDELREHAPPIYLCGVLELTEEDQAAFAARRIIPLNLGELFSRADYPQQDERHAAAIGWLLDVLQDGKPTRPGEWAPDHVPEARASRPPGPPRHRFTVFSESRPTHGAPLMPDKLREIAATWRAQRLEYPGWIVAPNPPRWRVWNHTHRWREPICEACGGLPLADQFQLLREMAWRFDLCLASLWTSEAQQIAQLLDRCNPFPGILQVSGTESQLPGVADADFAEGWIELAFAVMRVAREDLDAVVFKHWAAQLDRLLPVWPQLGPRLWAEQVFWAQAELDLDLLDERLKHWEANDRSLLGRAKIAAIKGELGRNEAAQRQASEVLQELRGKLGALQSPLLLLSLESWLINLVELLKDRPWLRQPEVRERLSELRRADCDPDEIIDDLRRRLRDFELPTSERADGPSFDPGYIEEPAREHTPDTSDMLPAFRVLRLVEVAPCAWRSQHFAFLSQEAAAAAVWLQTTAPFWSLGAIVRTNDKKAMSHYMDRASVFKLPADQVDRIWSILHRLTSQVLSRIPDDFRKASDDSACEMGAMALELLSRLTFRLKAAQLDELFNLLLRWLHSERASKVRSFDDAVRSLIDRLLFALPKDQLPNVAIRLIASPVKEDRGSGEIGRGHWPEVAESLDEIDEWPAVAVELPAGVFDRLIQHVRSDDSEARHRAAYRLLFLSERKWLKGAELQACGIAIWSSLDPGSGMPRHLQFTPFGYSKLPGAESNGFATRYRAQLEKGEFEPLTQPDGKSMRTGVLRHVRRSVGDVRRTYGLFYRHPPEHILGQAAAWRLVDGTIAWWEKNASVLRNVAAGKWRPLFTPTSAHLLAHEFVSVLGDCALPILKGDAAAHDKVLAWLTVVERDGFDPSCSSIGLLAIGKADPAAVAHRISSLLLATTRIEINDGSWLTTAWYRAHRAGKVPAEPPPWLVDLLAYRVTWRTEPSLGLSCDWLAGFIREWGEALSPAALSLLLQSLDVLLQASDFEGCWRNQPSQTAARKEAHRMMDIRTSATGVASALHRAAEKRGNQPHPVLEKWAKLATDHTLPEIRRAWQTYD